MTRISLKAAKDFEQGFQKIRTELDVPAAFPEAVLQEAADAQIDASIQRLDATDLGFLAIDPPGATDLDQAFFARKTAGGFQVFYAIADVGAFINPGSLLDQEARQRGVTLYSPDMKTPLHPPTLSEDKASLLAGKVTPALLWTIDLDNEGEETNWHIERATVKIEQTLSYTAAQQHIDSKPADQNDPLLLLSQIGRLRKQQERKRGGLSIQLPAQEIITTDSGYALGFDNSLPIENWNAQISLLTGMVAAKSMVEAGVGILRTLPSPPQEEEAIMRRTAQALAIDWPADKNYAAFIGDILADSPQKRALLVQATRSFRGAGYLSFSSRKELGEDFNHGAIASVYAHVTAPLRRLVDRFNNEILLAVSADTAVPSWITESLESLPQIMTTSSQKDSALDRTMLDFCETLVLENSIGEVFQGSVTDKRERKGTSSSIVQILDPAIVTALPETDLTLGQTVNLKLTAVSLEKRSLTFDVV